MTDKSLQQQLNELERKVKPVRAKEPLWKGPQKDGITFSLLSRYLTCKERFRILVMDGLRPVEKFNHRIEYGNLWHTCEEAYAAGHNWEAALKMHAIKLCEKFVNQQDEAGKWYEICKVQFPIYQEYYKKRREFERRTPLLQEEKFNLKYELPSGRTVRLLGKMDSVDYLHEEDGLILQENKTKGSIDPEQLERQLTFDLQTMLYIVALVEFKNAGGLNVFHKKYRDTSVIGVRYNVVRRPLSSGVKGNIVQKKATDGSKCPKCKGTGTTTPKRVGEAVWQCNKCNGQRRIGAKPAETNAEFYGRVASYIQVEPETYFHRWKIFVNDHDITKFQRECLDPELENLLDDYEWWKHCWDVNSGNSVYDYGYRARTFPSHRARHSRRPFGVYDVLAEGGQTDLDNYLASGTMLGLERARTLFPELEEV